LPAENKSVFTPGQALDPFRAARQAAGYLPHLISSLARKWKQISISLASLDNNSRKYFPKNMLNQEIKELIKKTGGKWVLAENGKSDFVVMSWNDFQEISSAKNEVKSLTEEELIDKINKDISLWREGQAQEGLEIDEIEELEDIEYV
jgi:hypothetical protein